MRAVSLMPTTILWPLLSHWVPGSGPRLHSGTSPAFGNTMCKYDDEAQQVPGGKAESPFAATDLGHK